ncbi:hypothetical protein P7C70_g2927, partial [Phenoliferia sp. Uapishka_3]
MVEWGMKLNGPPFSSSIAPLAGQHPTAATLARPQDPDNDIQDLADTPQRVENTILFPDPAASAPLWLSRAILNRTPPKPVPSRSWEGTKGVEVERRFTVGSARQMRRMRFANRRRCLSLYKSTSRLHNISSLRSRPLVLSQAGKWITSTSPTPYNLSKPARSLPPAPPTTITLGNIGGLAGLDHTAPHPLLAELKGKAKEDNVTGAGKGKVVRGVTIPQKPPPPKEGECCMSGCAHCVYDIYLSDLEVYHDQLLDARQALLSKGLINGDDWPPELGERAAAAEVGGAEGGGEGAAKRQAEKALEGVYKTLDPSMRYDRTTPFSLCADETADGASPRACRAFLEMEARLKKKDKDREA